MVSDEMLAALMDSVAQEDKEALMSMLLSMGAEDKAYFKGYVAGYSEAVRHLQAANQCSDGGDNGVQCPGDGSDAL